MKNWTKGVDYDHVIGEEGNIAILATLCPFTPVIVTHKYEDACSSFDAAYGEAELLGGRNCEDYTLTRAEEELLEDHYIEVNEWFDEQRPEGWDD